MGDSNYFVYAKEVLGRGTTYFALDMDEQGVGDSHTIKGLVGLILDCVIKGNPHHTETSFGPFRIKTDGECSYLRSEIEVRGTASQVNGSVSINRRLSSEEQKSLADCIYHELSDRKNKARERVKSGPASTGEYGD